MLVALVPGVGLHELRGTGFGERKGLEPGADARTKLELVQVVRHELEGFDCIAPAPLFLTSPDHPFHPGS